MSRHTAARIDVISDDGSYRFFTNKRCQHADAVAEEEGSVLVTYWVAEWEEEDRIQVDGGWGNADMMLLPMANGVAKAIKRLQKWAKGKGKPVVDEHRAEMQPGYVRPKKEEKKEEPASAPETPPVDLNEVFKEKEE